MAATSHKDTGPSLELLAQKTLRTEQNSSSAYNKHRKYLVVLLALRWIVTILH